MYFDELDLSDDILDALDAMRFEECTPIQEQTIPIILEGGDLIACAQTGTGKTAAYLLPVIDRIADDPDRGDKVQCLIMSPTRELTQQIDRQMEGFGFFLPVSAMAIYGGTDGAGFARQQRGLKMGADVVIATPGRLLDHIAMGYVDLSHVRYFILDEADRMLDMGFIHDIRRILPLLPERRQTLFFSATMPDDILRLASTMLRDPVHVSVTPPASVVETISQSIRFAEKADKKEALIALVEERPEAATLVFSRTKHGADRIARILTRAGIEARAIHGDKSQGARERAMNDFRSGACRVLIATDIAARGIDISELPLVVNYDLPEVPETYVHRIGRTGRAGHEGVAVSLCSEEERPLLQQILKLTGLQLEEDGTLAVAPPAPPKPRGPHAPKAAAPQPGRNGERSRQGAARGKGSRPAPAEASASDPSRRHRHRPRRIGAHAPSTDRRR